MVGNSFGLVLKEDSIKNVATSTAVRVKKRMSKRVLDEFLDSIFLVEREVEMSESGNRSQLYKF